MNNKVLCNFICGSLVAIASNAHATDASPSPYGFHPVPYLQGSFGVQQISSPSATGMAMNLNGSTTSTTPSVRGTVGVQFNRYWGFEGTWFQLPGTSVPTSAGGAAIKGSAYVASLTASMPLQMDIELVGRCGLGLSDVNVSVPTTTYSSDSRENLATWGVGARFGINKSTELTLDYDNLGAVGKFAQGDSVKVEMIAVGLRFKF